MAEWRKIGATVAGAVALVAGLWPVLTRKTLPELLLELGWPSMTAGLLQWVLALIGVGILLSTWIPRGKKQPEHVPAEPQWSETLTPVTGRTFAFSEVEIDGKAFLECTFTNATLVYRGTGPFAFQNSKFSNSGVVAKTSNKAAISYAQLLGMLQSMGFSTQLATQDAAGNLKFLPPPPKTAPASDSSSPKANEPKQP